MTQEFNSGRTIPHKIKNKKKSEERDWYVKIIERSSLSWVLNFDGKSIKKIHYSL